MIQKIFWAILLSFASLSAYAGRRAFVFTNDTELLSEGDLEVEEWLWGKARPELPEGQSVGWIWFGPVYGVSNTVEISTPWEMLINKNSSRITNFTLDLKFLSLKTKIRRTPFRVAIRSFYQLNFGHPTTKSLNNAPWLGGNLIFTLGNIDASHATLDVGALSDTAQGSSQSFRIGTLAMGYTHSVKKNFRLGGEYYFEKFTGSINHNAYSHFVGPSFGFSKGQGWMSFGVLKGLKKEIPPVLTRLIFGIFI